MDFAGLRPGRAGPNKLTDSLFGWKSDAHGYRSERPWCSSQSAESRDVVFPSPFRRQCPKRIQHNGRSISNRCIHHGWPPDGRRVRERDGEWIADRQTQQHGFSHNARTVYGLKCTSIFGPSNGKFAYPFSNKIIPQ